MTDVTGLLTRFVAATTYRDLPPAAVEATKRCLLDALGVTLAAGTLGEGCAAFVAMAEADGGRPESSILGFGSKVPAASAAFANGAMAHALDFEDAHDAALVHPNAPTVPAALAVAQARGGVSGRELIAALAVGCEIVCRMGLALRESPDKYGWYQPPILAAFGATAAAGKLLGLDPGQLRDAFSLALCQATCSAELKYSPQSTIRAVRDAFAARIGVVSAELARRGIKGFDHPLEGKAGFYALYARGAYDPEALVKGLGHGFAIESISFKPWPSCRGTHAFIEATLSLAKDHRLAPNDVAAIHLTGHSLNTMLAEPFEQKRAPVTAIDAKFSLPFTVATALHRGDVSLDHFRPAALVDSEVLATARKVSFAADGSSGTGMQDVTRGRVEIRTVGGASYAKKIDFPLGSPANPLSREALITKFRACAGYAPRPLGDTRTTQTIDQILGLEHLSEIRDLAILN